MTNSVIRIAPSDISFLANCPHCLWHKYNTGLKNEAGFPGVFSMLDISQKQYFNPLRVKEISETLPDGVVDTKIADKFITSRGLDDLKGRLFKLGGKADLILKFEDGTYGVIDNKTTKIRENQEYYFYQLESYATILENPDYPTACKFLEANRKYYYKPVTHMGLSMFEPARIIDHTTETITQLYRRKWMPIKRDPQKLLEKITSMMDIITLEKCPDASSCNRCNLYKSALNKIS